MPEATKNRPCRQVSVRNDRAWYRVRLRWQRVVGIEETSIGVRELRAWFDGGIPVEQRMFLGKWWRGVKRRRCAIGRHGHVRSGRRMFDGYVAVGCGRRVLDHGWLERVGAADRLSG
jgi:hypothetical protein